MTRNTNSSKLALALLIGLSGAAQADPVADYNEWCAECHDANRLGGTGPPALIPPETLRRMRGPKIEAVIREGRVATQMPAFAEDLSDERITALAEFLKTPPLETIPAWGGADEINASRVMDEDYVAAEAPPVWDADPMNITLAVETGDHHVSVLNGDTFEVLDRFATPPFAVHGGPKFSPPDGRYVFIMSRDGGFKNTTFIA